MERYLINTVKNHRCYSYISSQFSFFHLFLSPLLRNKTNASAPKAKDGPTQHCLGETGREQRVIAQENASYTKEAKKIFESCKARAKPNTDHKEPRFYGDVVIFPDKEKASTKATNIFQFNAGRRHWVGFVDGSNTTTPRKSTTPSLDSDIPSGAAVVFKPKKDDNWNVKYFTPLGRGRDSAFTELDAIAKGLLIAKTEMLLYLDNNKKTSNGKARWSKVTIFSDCTSALEKIRKLRERAITDVRLLGDPIICQLLDSSRYLYDNGVQVELRWVHGHSETEGNRRAHNAARYAARHPGVGILL